MSYYPFRFEIPAPHPEGILRLPRNSGSVTGRLKTIEVRARGEFWAHIAVPTWERWSVQILVGEPCLEGIGPTTIDVWAPAKAVELDEGDLQKISELIEAKAHELRAA